VLYMCIYRSSGTTTVQLGEFELTGGNAGFAPLLSPVVKSMAPSSLPLFASKPSHAMILSRVSRGVGNCAIQCLV